MAHLKPKHHIDPTPNSLVRGKEFVQWTGSGHLHDQHQVLSAAQAQHANDVAVFQLVHDLCLPHHLVPHQLLVFILQNLDGHISLTPEKGENIHIESLTFLRATCSACACSSQQESSINKRMYLSVWRNPLLTQPKFPEPSSTSSILSWSLWIVNFLTSFGLWYGLLSESSISVGLVTPTGATTHDTQQQILFSNEMCMQCAHCEILVLCDIQQDSCVLRAVNHKPMVFTKIAGG